MPITTTVCHVVSCDVCPAVYELDDHIQHYPTAAEAEAWVFDPEGTWTRSGKRIICPRSDAEHDDARDAEALTRSA